MAAADKKITYTAAEVAELIRPTDIIAEALQKENDGAEAEAGAPE